MTNASQRDKVEALVQDALRQGATLFAEKRPQGVPAAGLFMPVRVLTDVTHDMRIMREEIFGPVVGVMRVDEMDQAVVLANDSRLALTASVWSRRRRHAAALARRLQAGVVMVNDHLMSHGLAETPWGGWKESGIGWAHGPPGVPGDAAQPGRSSRTICPSPGATCGGIPMTAAFTTACAGLWMPSMPGAAAAG